MSLSNRHNIPGLQDAPQSGDLQQSQWMQQVTQLVRQGTGQHGRQDEKWLTLQDLEQLQIVEQLPGGGWAPGSGGGWAPGSGGGGGEEPPDTSPPEPLRNLEARGGMTAIRVIWDSIEYSYYYRIEVHKASVNDLSEAFLVGTTQGNIYQDVVGSDTTTWYYWARVVKQIGAVTVVGPWNQTDGTPAAAASDPDWILGDLEGQIGDSHLNDDLNSSIDKIPEIERDVSDIEDSIWDIEIDISDLETGLNTEINERQDEDEQLHKRIDTNVSRIGDNESAIVIESETRADETSALARQIETLVADVGDNRAAIQTESEVRATEDEVLASRITTMQAEVDGNRAAIQSESEVRASEDEVLASRIDTQTARIDDNAAAIQTESEVRATEDEALASQITTLAAEVDDNTAAIQTESEVRATEDEVLASRITDVQVEFEGEFAGIRDEMTVIINDQEAMAERVGSVELDLEETRGAVEQQFRVIDDELEGIRAEYTVKLEIEDEDGNSYVGGFGLVNDGDTIMALWRVDVFAVGQPGCDSLTFAIDTEENRVVMDGALIRNASITTAQIGELDVDRLVGGTADFVEANIRDGSIVNAKIGNVIQSDGFVSGDNGTGWQINKSGRAEFHNVLVRGTIRSSEMYGGKVDGTLIIGGDIVSSRIYVGEPYFLADPHGDGRVTYYIDYPMVPVGCIPQINESITRNISVNTTGVIRSGIYPSALNYSEPYTNRIRWLHIPDNTFTASLSCQSGMISFDATIELVNPINGYVFDSHEFNSNTAGPNVVVIGGTSWRIVNPGMLFNIYVEGLSNPFGNAVTTSYNGVWQITVRVNSITSGSSNYATLEFTSTHDNETRS